MIILTRCAGLRAKCSSMWRHGRRFEVVSGLSGSEGMLLYLDKLAFAEADEAVQKWNDGELDALVLPADLAEQVMRRLHDNPTATLRSTHRKSQPRVDYQLVVKNS